MKDINKKTKTKLLLSFLENVPFDGWSWETLYFSAVDISLIKSKKITEIEKGNIRNIFNNTLFLTFFLTILSIKPFINLSKKLMFSPKYFFFPKFSVIEKKR